MTGLVFDVQPPLTLPVPNRADVACFVGLVGRRQDAQTLANTAIPKALQHWLLAQGWLTTPVNRPETQAHDLQNLPVLIESWEVFDRLFAWDRRESGQAEQSSCTYLGAAVRSFFAQGGRRCYVIRVADPLPLGAPQDARLAQIPQLLPGYPQRLTATPLDRSSWRGVGHLFGLSEVSFVCLPDLPDLVRRDRPLPELPRVPVLPEQFVECSEPAPAQTDRRSRALPAPRCDLQGYTAWATALGLVANLLRRLQREVQLVAALPLPQPNSDGAIALQDYLALLMDEGRSFIDRSGWREDFVPPLAYGVGDRPQGLASAFVQLVYPWVRTPGSAQLPEQLEPPEGVLIGLLARNALTRGSFRSAAGLPLGDVSAVEPTLTRTQLLTPHGMARSFTLLERISLLGPTPAGLRLLSDVTTSPDDSYRPASVNRLVAALVRAARSLGEVVSFEASAEDLWTRVKRDLEALLLGLWQAGALAGANPSEAFSVRCDRTTTRQADLDNGRVIAEVQFTAAVPIEEIRVVLAMSEGGQVSLLPPP